MKENSVPDDIAGEEEIKLTKTVSGKILESSMKSQVDSEFTTPYSQILKQPNSILQFEVTNRYKSEFDTSCMEMTDVITNNLLLETVYSHSRPDSKYKERRAISECQSMEISPCREMMPMSRKSIFHLDQDIPAQKSIFDLPPSQLPALDSVVIDTNLYSKDVMWDKSVSMDVSIPLGEESEENLPLGAMTLGNINNKPRSLYSVNHSMHQIWRSHFVHSGMLIQGRMFSPLLEEKRPGLIQAYLY